MRTHSCYRTSVQRLKSSTELSLRATCAKRDSVEEGVGLPTNTLDRNTIGSAKRLRSGVSVVVLPPSSCCAAHRAIGCVRVASTGVLSRFSAVRFLTLPL